MSGQQGSHCNTESSDTKAPAPVLSLATHKREHPDTEHPDTISGVSGASNPQNQTLLVTGTDLSLVPRTWKCTKLLGAGSFSCVWLANLVSDDPVPSSNISVVAIKVTRLESALEREMAILARMNHPCIISVLGCNAKVEGAKACVLSYCKGGDLLELSSKHRAEIRPFLLRRLFAEIAAAVNYLHKQWVVHRDIKLENVLITIEPHVLFVHVTQATLPPVPLTKLTDFGLSREISPADHVLTTRCGSEDYVAPELLMGEPYDGRVTDVWALGVLLYALMEGRLPFDPPPPVFDPVTNTVRPQRVRRRTPHRIARIDWQWYFFKYENADSSDENHGDYRYNSEFWGPAKELVEGMLVKREKRFSSGAVVQNAWCWDALPEEIRDATIGE